MLIASLLALAAAAGPSCEASLASARPAIEHANGDWIRALRAGDAAALAEAYADDGVFVLPDGRSVNGREAVRALYAARAAKAAQIVDGGIHSLGQACGSGGLVYEWGEAKCEPGPPKGRSFRAAVLT
jgi:ketosteroid isomerase-like protein